jgi:beta-galactosidase
LNNILLTPGKFNIGCNYWASHAGTNMWRNWQAEVVEDDFRQMSDAGLQVLRVFPLWPDFQPISQLYGGGGSEQEVRWEEEPLLFDDYTQYPTGLSPLALDRFDILTDLAMKYNLKLIVGLLTGWMSGRLFVPPALQGRNVLTDPVAIMWETRFVRGFVHRFKHIPAILAWDLGNECNCMAPVPSAEAAWVWTSAICSAIRATDSEHPIVSGMHSLDEPDETGLWRIMHQAELTDVLTTHPYPYFTPHCDMEPINTLRNGYHATAQTRWYADIGRVAGLAEELGTLGPMFASDEFAADYLRMVLYSLWANDCRGLLWWCGYDQDHLVHAPYDWTPIERQLGLFHSDRRSKPVVQVLKDFRKKLDDLPIDTLPQHCSDAVCILTHGQESWAVAYASFILAKQAGIDITFQYANQPLIDSKCYLLPSVTGGSPFSRRFWYTLDEKIQAGATLYLSMNDAILSPFKEPFGIEVQTRQKRLSPLEFSIEMQSESYNYLVDTNIRYNLITCGADVLGTEKNGNVAFSCNYWGKGKVYFLSAPIELYLSNITGGFNSEEAQPFWKIYQAIAKSQLEQRLVTKKNPLMAITEHTIDQNHCVVVLINYSPNPMNTQLFVKENWLPVQSWIGKLPILYEGCWMVDIPKNDAVVFKLQKITGC